MRYLTLFLSGLLLIFGCAAHAQTSTLGVSSAIVNPGGSALLGVALNVSGTAPAGLEWTIAYSPAQISAISITPGPAATAALKTLSCASAPGAVTCILTGLNTNALGSGPVAYLNATVAPGTTIAPIQISNSIGVDSIGNGLPVMSAVEGTIAVPSLLPVACSPTALSASALSTCTITLTQAAPAGGSNVTLAGNNTLLTVPASVTVAAGATTATFSAIAAAPIANNQSAAITATLGSSSQTANISLLASILVSGVACSPGSLGQSATGICTVTLAQTAPAGGSNVTLTSNNASLTVPASVTVAARSTTATFSATAGASIQSNQSATVTATFGGSSQTAVIGLVAPVQVSGVACSPAVLGPGGSSNCSVSLTQAVAAISLVHVTSCGPKIFPASTCTIPATGSGNLIVVAWGSAPNVSPKIGTVTDNAGNTYMEAGNAWAADPAAGAIDIWYAANSKPGTTTMTITPSVSSLGAAVIWEFSNVDLTAPLDQTSVLNGQPATTTASGASVATTVPGDLVISVLTPSGTTLGIQPGSVFTLDSLLFGNGWSHATTSSAGSYAPQWNTALGSYASSTVSFRPAGSVALSSNNTLLTVPASVTVAVGATTATFSATAAASIASNQSATVTATLGTSSQTARISLVAPVSGFGRGLQSHQSGAERGQHLHCDSDPDGPTGGSSVTLASNNASLTVPASVTVAAGATTATFSATAAASIASNQSATVTATLGSSSQTATSVCWRRFWFRAWPAVPPVSDRARSAPAR